MTGSLAAQVCGCTAYNVLAASLHKAFPTWASGRPESVPDGMEITDDHRAMMRSKTGLTTPCAHMVFPVFLFLF